MCMRVVYYCRRVPLIGNQTCYTVQRGPINANFRWRAADRRSSFMSAGWIRFASCSARTSAFWARSTPHAIEHRRDSDLVPFPHHRQDCGSVPGFWRSWARWTLQKSNVQRVSHRSELPTTSHGHSCIMTLGISGLYTILDHFFEWTIDDSIGYTQPGQKVVCSPSLLLSLRQVYALYLQVYATSEYTALLMSITTWENEKKTSVFVLFETFIYLERYRYEVYMLYPSRHAVETTSYQRRCNHVSFLYILFTFM